MTIKTALIASVVVLGFVAPGFAADAKDTGKEKAKQPPEWAGLFGDASLPVIWQSAQAASEKITAAIADKKLEGIPDWAETIHLASHALQAQVQVSDFAPRQVPQRRRSMGLSEYRFTLDPWPPNTATIIVTARDDRPSS